jgi:hypothetical protein
VVALGVQDLLARPELLLHVLDAHMPLLAAGVGCTLPRLY